MRSDQGVKGDIHIKQAKHPHNHHPAQGVWATTTAGAQQAVL